MDAEVMLLQPGSSEDHLMVSNPGHVEPQVLRMGPDGQGDCSFMGDRSSSAVLAIRHQEPDWVELRVTRKRMH